MADLILAVVLLVAALCPWWLLRDLRTLPAGPAAAARTPSSPSISVVIPARDEEHTLPLVLASLARLSVPVDEIVVVDDGSSDRTAEVARAAARARGRGNAPAAGWTGKAWACQTGAGATTGGLLLFLDADTALAPDAMDGLLALHEQHGGLVSVQPFHRVVRPYEQLSAYFNVVSLLASGAFTRRPVGSAHGVRPVPADLPRRLRQRRWPRGRARRDPRRRTTRRVLRPRRAAGAVRRRRRLPVDAELSRRPPPAGLRVDQERRVRRGGRGSARDPGRGALDLRPPRRRRRRTRAAGRGADRTGRTPSPPGHPCCGASRGWPWPGSCGRSCAAPGPSGGGPGRCSPCRCSPST